MPDETELFEEGEALFEKGRYLEAISKFNQVLELVKDTNNDTLVVNVHTKLGECYHHLLNLKEAMHHFQEAHFLAEEQNLKQFLAISYVNMTKVLIQFIRQGDSSSADQVAYYIQEALSLFSQLNDTSGLKIAQELRNKLESLERNLEMNTLFSSLPINLTPNILLRSGTDVCSVILETVRGESQLSLPQLDALINTLQLIRDKMHDEDRIEKTILKAVYLITEDGSTIYNQTFGRIEPNEADMILEGGNRVIAIITVVLDKEDKAQVEYNIRQDLLKFVRKIEELYADELSAPIFQKSQFSGVEALVKEHFTSYL